MSTLLAALFGLRETWLGGSASAGWLGGVGCIFVARRRRSEPWTAGDRPRGPGRRGAPHHEAVWLLALAVGCLTSPTASFRRRPESSALDVLRSRPSRTQRWTGYAAPGQRHARWIPAVAGMTAVGALANATSHYPDLILRCERSEPRRTTGDTPRVVRGSPSARTSP